MPGHKIKALKAPHLKERYDQKFWSRLQAAIEESFWEYTEITKVSGIWMLRQHRTQGLTRWIWSAVLLHLLGLAFFLALQLWLKFYSYPILNTIAANLPITEVAFPGITVCSPKVVNYERVDRLLGELYIPPQYNKAEVAEGFEYFNAFTDQNWIIPNNSHYALTDAVLQHNNISIYTAAVEISAGCEEFVRICLWGRGRFPCLQNHEFLAFTPTTSYLGTCCSFNYNPRNSSYVPFASNIFGIDGGLTFLGIEGSEKALSTGLLVLVHHPKDFVTDAASSVTITSNSESFIEILPTVHSSSVDVLELSETKRDCLISNDLELRNYRQASCLLNCQSEIIYKECNCLPYHFPRQEASQHIRECKLKDGECYIKNLDKFKSVRCPHCLPNCYDVTYSTMAYKTDLLMHNYSVNSLYSYINTTNDTFIARVYLTTQVVPSVRKVIAMSWISLLSDLGGVFNLCLGLSIISLVEFFFYGVYRVHKNLQTRSVLIKKPTYY